MLALWKEILTVNTGALTFGVIMTLLNMYRPEIHLFLHFFIPCLFVTMFAGNPWSNWLKLVSTMLVDLDHIVAQPIYDPDRCSIGFHPLHSNIAIFSYALLIMPKKSRIFGTGLMIHMALDGVDCHWLTL